MSALLKFLATLPFAALLLWTAFSNRGLVDLSFSPVHDPVALPFGVIVLICVAFGFVWGSVIVWLNGAELRRDLRRRKKDVVRLQKDLDAAQSSGSNPLHQSKTFLPHPYP
jgi:uncharacterized integral membrane protein